MGQSEASAFGALLKRYRLAAELTQEELAERALISARAISDLERGVNRTARRDTVGQLIEALDLSPPEQASLRAAASKERTIGLPKTDLSRGRVEPRGVSDPIDVIQDGPDGSDDRVAPSPTVATVTSSDLSHQPTAFVGRARELADISEILVRDDVQLLTLVGTGGVGKTRVAVQAAKQAASNFPDGVFFVSLAPLTDPSLVLSTIAAAMGLADNPGTTDRGSLENFLRGKRLLLLLDNFEHLLDARIVPSQLLALSPTITLLVTSRISLNLAAEHLYAIPPLSVPDAGRTPDLDLLSEYDAVALFIQRAKAANAAFRVTNENASDIVEICVRVDALPLAIELAAARIKLFPPRALLSRLSQRLSLLTDGAKDRPSRQQTLRAAFDWSYDLLPEEDRKLFARLSVFAGSCSLEAVENVCAIENEPPMDSVKGLSSLVDKSMVFSVGALEVRVSMLDTMREYASERLTSRGERGALQRRHALFMLALAEKIEPHVFGAHQVAWLETLEADHDNFRSALGWCLDNHQGEIGLRLLNALWRFWQAHAHLHEGYTWMKRLLEMEQTDHAHGLRPASHGIRAKALMLAGAFATNQGDYAEALPLAQESLALFRRIQDDPGVASALNVLGNIAYRQGDYGSAERLFAQCLELRRSGQPRERAQCLNNLASVAGAQGNAQRAACLYRESLEISRQLGDRYGMAQVLDNLAQIVMRKGEFDEALTLLEESLAAHRELGDVDGMAHSLDNRGVIARMQGNIRDAVGLHYEALVHYLDAGDKYGTAECLEQLAGALSLADHGELAAKLFGAASVVRDTIGAPVSLDTRDRYEADIFALQAALGSGAFETDWKEGRSWSLDDVRATVNSVVLPRFSMIGATPP